MGVLVRCFKSPRIRLRIPFLPGFGSKNPAAVLGDVDARFEVVPFIWRPLKRRRGSKELLIGSHFEHLRVSLQVEKVALINQAYFGHLALITLAEDVRFDRVIVEVGTVDEYRAPLETLVIDRLYQGFVAILVAHLELEARGIP